MKEGSVEDRRHSAEFDAYSEDYESLLNQGLRYSGEGRDYFAQKRVEWVAGVMQEFGVAGVASVGGVGVGVDFGCGTGESLPLLKLGLGLDAVWGVEVSEASLEKARRFEKELNVRVYRLMEVPRAPVWSLVYCNGVFHHIPVGERDEVLRWIWERTLPGGWFAFWENNPWNPGTRWIMSRVPFDRDAVTLSLVEAKDRLRRAGFEVIRCRTLFYFPRMLRFLRGLEPVLGVLPFGGQYVVWCRKAG